MAGLIVEGADPVDYGFFETPTRIAFMQQYIVEYCPHSDIFENLWSYIQKRLIDNKSNIINTPYWQYLKWMEKCDFEHPETLKMPLMFRIRRYLSSFKFYNKLHHLKSLILKNKKD